jgi:hypothetical protein
MQVSRSCSYSVTRSLGSNFIAYHTVKLIGNKIIGTNQSAKIFNNHFINSVDELIIQQPNTESAMFSLRESFPYAVPQIINIPITEAQVICAISLLKNKTVWL